MDGEKPFMMLIAPPKQGHLPKRARLSNLVIPKTVSVIEVKKTLLDLK